MHDETGLGYLGLLGYMRGHMIGPSCSGIYKNSAF